MHRSFPGPSRSNQERDLYREIERDLGPQSYIVPRRKATPPPIDNFTNDEHLTASTTDENENIEKRER